MTANIDPGTVGWVFLYYKDIFNKDPTDLLFFIEDNIGNTWVFKTIYGEYDDPADGAPNKGKIGTIQDFKTTPEIHTEAQFEGVMTYREYLALRRKIQWPKPTYKLQKTMNRLTKNRNNYRRRLKYKLPTIREVNTNVNERRSRITRRRRRRANGNC